ncbi:MAG: uracil phosphoribosyltransferase [Bdellovibrionales bacterium CG10_big_fil_rev_8_21_14_0_10_45_34]|nr:MAG: uracil phosphoribosyltransferase [Bdellovibrionales bacterium CG10_big_fil_rev_8_21_14_0_10_45_34]
MQDSRFDRHCYGENFYLVKDTYLRTLLARLCTPDCVQPEINHLVETIYRGLLSYTINQFFATELTELATRMTASHTDIKLKEEMVIRKQRAVAVNLARAGTYPSHICYQHLNEVLEPNLVRQDHILAARLTNESHQVTGTFVGGTKIGGDIQDAIVLIPDPMGATGNTLVSAIEHYNKNVEGDPKHYVALHLIVTPEYLKKVYHTHPKLKIVSLRLDRGLSSPDILRTLPGTHWDRERGLNNQQYIVPGGGGFGEILNNSYV